jgi:hypothetical protein
MSTAAKKPKSTVGVVFIKCHDGQVGQFDSDLCTLKEEINQDDGHPCRIELVAIVAGSFDFFLIVRAERAKHIQELVLKRLRARHHDKITDTQTFVGWDSCTRPSVFGEENANEGKDTELSCQQTG